MIFSTWRWLSSASRLRATPLASARRLASVAATPWSDQSGWAARIRASTSARPTLNTGGRSAAAAACHSANRPRRSIVPPSMPATASAPGRRAA